MILVVEPVASTTALRVLAGSDGGTVLGFIRWAADLDKWVARSLGPLDGSAAGTVRKFPDKTSALAWLAEREPAPARRRSPPECVLRAMEDDPAPLSDCVAAAWDPPA